MKKVIVLSLFLMGVAFIGKAARRDTTAVRDSLPPIIKTLNAIPDWLKKSKIQLRKSLDGSKDEQKPASMLWSSDYENKLHYFSFDGGLKISEVELFKNSPVALLLYPKVEWHKNNIPKDDKKKNNLTGGINGELHIQGGGDCWVTHPFFTGLFDYKNDMIKDLKTIQGKAFLSFNGNKNFQPGASTRRKDSITLLLRYYPYTGLENYRSVGTTKGSALFWTNRFFLEYYPIALNDRQYLQLTVDYTYRVAINDDLYKQGNVSWLSVGLNIYPTGKSTIGFGLDYSNGYDPNSNFLKTDLLAFGIKFKI